MDIVTDGLLHKIFGDPESVGQLPDLAEPFGDSSVQFGHWDQRLDGPFVGSGLMPLSAIEWAVLVVETAGDAVPKLVS